jgi:hypothetical protein
MFRAMVLGVTEYDQMEEASGGKRRASQVRDIAGLSSRIPRHIRTAHTTSRRIGSCLAPLQQTAAAAPFPQTLRNRRQQ